jgi:FAD/FMN-containing dehydrogenase
MWADWLGQADAGDVVLRVGVPHGAVGAFLRSGAWSPADTRLFVDAAAGHVFMVIRCAESTACERVPAIRRAATLAGGYAVVLSMPEALEGEVERWGSESLALGPMRALKAALDPAGILNRGAFVV